MIAWHFVSKWLSLSSSKLRRLFGHQGIDQHECGFVGGPYNRGTAVAAIWTRDSKRWHLDRSLSKAELPAPDAPASKNGLLLADNRHDFRRMMNPLNLSLSRCGLSQSA